MELAYGTRVKFKSVTGIVSDPKDTFAENYNPEFPKVWVKYDEPQGGGWFYHEPNFGKPNRIEYRPPATGGWFLANTLDILS